MRTLIVNGTVVTATDSTAADVLIEDELVAALLAPGSFEGTADHTIDAIGKYVVPGGIDVHTHMELPFGGTAASDSFETGTRAAAWGGTTTIVDFAVQTKGQSLMEGFEAWMAKAEGNCAIDYGFHLIVGDVTEQSLKEMDMAMDEGVTSFKMFMAYPGVFYSTDGEILRAMQKAAENGSTIMMHAENGIAIDVLIEQALARGETDPIHHGLVRRSVLEGEATHRAIKLAEVAGCPLYIVHLSAQEALEEVSHRPRHGEQRLRRDMPAVPLPRAGRPWQRLRGRQVRVLPASPRPSRGSSGGAVGRAGEQRSAGGVHRPLPILFRRPPRIGEAEAPRRGRFLQDPQRTPRGGAPNAAHLPGSRRRGASLGQPLGGGVRHHTGEDVRALPAARARSRWDPMQTSSCSTRIVPWSSPPRPNTCAPTTPVTRAWRSPARSTPSLSRGKVVIADGEYHGSPGDGRYLPRETNQYLI